MYVGVIHVDMSCGYDPYKFMSCINLQMYHNISLPHLNVMLQNMNSPLHMVSEGGAWVRRS